MGITFNHDDWDGVADQIDYIGVDVVEKAFARELANRARDAGLTSADSLPLAVETDLDRDNNAGIDTDRVRALANEILTGASGSPDLR